MDSRSVWIDSVVSWSGLDFVMCWSVEVDSVLDSAIVFVVWLSGLVMIGSVME